jgi:hypothetical protein
MSSARCPASIQLFVCLQLADLATTLLGFHAGLREGSPFVRVLMHLGPLAGIVFAKMGALALGGFCIQERRLTIIEWANCWLAFVVCSNLALMF